MLFCTISTMNKVCLDPESQTEIPELETTLSARVRAFLDWLQDNRAFSSLFYVVR